jgi:hypothetical protein
MFTCEYKKNKDDTTTTTTPLPCHRESHEQPTKGQMTPVNSRLGASGSRGHPPDLSLRLCYSQTQEAPTRTPLPTPDTTLQHSNDTLTHVDADVATIG